MKIHRFINNFDLSGSEVEITGEIAHQMAKVLKLEIGEQVEFCNGKGTNALGKIKILNKNSAIVEIDPLSIKLQHDKGNTVSLFCAVLKKENFELVVQKATECGVSKIIPVITTRTIKTGLNVERLQKIIKEACEQSGRSILPEVLEPIAFDEALKIIEKDHTNIIFDITGEKFSDLVSDSKPVNIFIGPEGGWTPEELTLTSEHGFKIVNLGTTTLRGETAAIIASYLAINNQS